MPAPPPNRVPDVPRPAAPVRRDEVLERAAGLLHLRGFSGFTLEELQRTTGLTHGKLMEVCLSREDLIFQVLRRQVDEVLSQADALVAPDVPVMELMRGLSERLFLEIERRPLVLQLLLGDAADALPAWAERLDELRRRCLAVPVKLVRLGIEQELIRDDLPEDLLANLLFEIHVAGYLLSRHSGPDAKLRASQRRLAILDVLYNGLRRR